MLIGLYRYRLLSVHRRPPSIDQCRPSNVSPHMPMGRLAEINTPLRWQAWEAALRNHQDQPFANYLVSGLRDGFRIGFGYPRPCRSSSINMHSVREHAQIVSDYLSNECAEGGILGPLTLPWSEEIHISRFGIIPKGSSGKWRLILDLSSPEGASVNDGIDGACALLNTRRSTRQPG